jgi:replication-associated recombination protein RarA
MNTNFKYRPEKISDVVWASDELEEKIKRYAEGRNSRPLILHGPYGTGKSLIAGLIPKAIDGDAVQVARIRPDELNSSDAVQKIFSRGRLFDRLFVPPGQRQTYTVMDEITISPKATNALRITLDEMEGRDLTIMTTNELGKLDPAIRSRAEVVLVPPVPPERFLKRAQEILVSEDVLLDDATVREVLEAAFERCEDNREYYKALDEIIDAAKNGTDASVN